MKIGIVTGIPWQRGQTQAEAYQAAIAQAEWAEALGFDSVWTTEHHFARHGLNSAILTFSAHLAARTKHLRIGTAVLVLPYWDPLRLAEETAVVDIVSGGRLDVGIGRGYRYEEFRGFNVPVEESRGRFAECLDILHKAWTAESVSYSGTYYTVRDVSVRPQPLQHPHPPLWVSGTTPESIEWAARSGYHWMMAGGIISFLQMQEARKRYDAALAAAGRHPGEAEFYLHFPIYVAEKTSAEIRQETEEAMAWFYQVAVSGGTIYDQPGRRLTFDYEALCQNVAVFGDPERVQRRLEELWRGLHFTQLVMLSPPLPLDQTIQSMELFARTVMPALRAL
ncbi:MAG TPA: LLM class flavin-dependent oxidoreductase [Candidatus Binatia bacterium]|nr:LLM class flavin-dependent oxidoreductase [Candidatus Binatia bacterium]